MSKPQITHVYEFSNGMVMVFDQHGQQMPEFQGPKEDVEQAIRQVAPHVVWRDARFGPSG